MEKIMNKPNSQIAHYLLLEQQWFILQFTIWSLFLEIASNIVVAFLQLILYIVGKTES